MFLRGTPSQEESGTGRLEIIRAAIPEAHDTDEVFNQDTVIANSHESSYGQAPDTQDNAIAGERGESACSTSDDFCLHISPTEHPARSRRAFPQYVTLRSRQGSFVNYPEQASVNTKEMAMAGFFYTGVDDETKCFQCGVRFCSWKDGDDPVLEHARWMPDCPYIGSRAVRNNELSATQEECAIPHPTPYVSPDISVQDSAHFGGSHRFSQSSQPVFPQHATLQSRQWTFESYPRDVAADKEDMANAGLFYTGVDYQTICFQCGVSIHHWEDGDSPVLEHARWMPDCSYVALMRASSELNLNGPGDIRRASAPESGETDEVLNEEIITTNCCEGACGPALHAEGSAEDVNQEHHIAPGDSHGACSTLDSTYIIPYSRPAYPKYAEISKRRDSFNTYPEKDEGKKENMARAGFFYTGEDDNVRCFHCGLTCAKWDADDEPAVEHARWKGDCCFIRLYLGDEFISHVRKVQEGHVAQRLAEEKRSTDAPTEVRARELMSLYNAKPALPDTVSLGIVELAIRHRLNTTGKIDVEDEEDLSTAVGDVMRLPRNIEWRETYDFSISGEQPLSHVPEQKHRSAPQCGSDDNRAIGTEASVQGRNKHTVSFSRPAFPEYITLVSRERSFLAYPKDAKGNTEKMARAGFFYTGHDDCTTCFQCGLSLGWWIDDDNPVADHARFFADCPYVRGIFRGGAVDHVRETHVGAEREPVEQCLSDERTSLLLHDLMCSPVVLRLLEQWVHPDVMQLAILNRLNTTGLIDVLDEHDIRRALADRTSLPENVRARAVSGLRGRNVKKCVICFRADRNFIFLPCTHLVACKQCAKECRACPVCNSRVCSGGIGYL